MDRRGMLVACFLVITLVFVVRSEGSASGAFLTVDTLADENDGSCSDDDCSLRDAIEVANPNATIQFGVTGTITLSLGSLVIDKNLTLVGPGSPALIISGNYVTRLFRINLGVRAAISGLEMEAGFSGSGTDGDGGAIYNLGELTLNGCDILANHSLGDGGGIYNDGGLTINDSNLTYNLADHDGGGIFNDFDATATMQHVDFFSNSAENDGGAVGNFATSLLAMTDSLFVVNQAGNNGGAIYNAIDTNVTLIEAEFAKNGAGNNGGGIQNAGSMALSGGILSDSSAGNDGGGIANTGYLKLTGVTISWNKSGNSGGGLANSGSAEMVVCTFSKNYTDGDGGGITNNGLSLDISTSTFDENDAAGNGGGIANLSSALDITVSTFSGNTAAEGSGIYNTYDATATFRNTIIANSNSVDNCSGSFMADSTHNLDTDGSCAPGFNQVTPAQLALGALTGSPAYFPLDPDSAAIDSGTTSGCHTSDQRGMPRPQDGDGDGIAICDVGSYEYGGFYRLFLPLNLKD